MIELLVTLDLACYGCHDSICVMLKCAGEKEKLAEPIVATIYVPCPHCMRLNSVNFDSTGTVRDVEPAHDPRRLPAPSIN